MFILRKLFGSAPEILYVFLDCIIAVYNFYTQNSINIIHVQSLNGLSKLEKLCFDVILSKYGYTRNFYKHQHMGYRS